MFDCFFCSSNSRQSHTRERTAYMYHSVPFRPYSRLHAKTHFKKIRRTFLLKLGIHHFRYLRIEKNYTYAWYSKHFSRGGEDLYRATPALIRTLGFCSLIQWPPQDRRSSVMEVILVFTHSHWWDKAYTLCRKYVGFFRLWNIISLFCMSVIFKHFKMLRQTNLNKIEDTYSD